MADPLRQVSVYRASGTTSMTATFAETTPLDSTHLLVAVIHVNSSTTVATPSGWTAPSGNGAYGTIQVRTFVRQGNGTINSLTVTPASGSATVILMAFKGYSSTTILGFNSGNGTVATTTRALTFNAGLGSYGVSIASFAVSAAVTWGAVTNGTRVGATTGSSTPVHPDQLLAVATATYTNTSLTVTQNWTPAQTQRYDAVLLPLISDTPRPVIEYFDTAWNTSGANSGYGSSFKELDIPNCRVGDLIVAYGAAENFTQPEDTRLFSDITPGGSITGTWTQTTGLPGTGSQDTDVYGGYALVTADGTVRVRFDSRTSDSNKMGLGVYRLDSSLVSPTRGFAPYMTNSTTSLINTTLAENCMVIYAASDWNALSMGTTPTPSDGTVYRSYLTAGQYAVWSALWQNQAAGTRNYGPSGLSGTDSTGFVFYMATPASSKWFTSTGASLKPYTLTGSGLIELL